jgi:hypothetical protein
MERFVDEGLELATDEEIRNWLTVLKGTSACVGVVGLDDPLRIDERVAPPSAASRWRAPGVA